jgi:hypothetical protein
LREVYCCHAVGGQQRRPSEEEGRASTAADDGGWQQFHSGSGPGVLNSGLYAGITAQISLETGPAAGSGGIEVLLVQDEAGVPACLALYQTNQTGTIVIRNNENAEIRDVRVSFHAGSYTASEFPCGSIPLIPRGRRAELPLYADFSPELLGFTAAGRVLGEVVISYRFLGQERVSKRTISLAVHNRNTLAVEDPAALAAFVSPSSPEVLEYAKYISGLARTGQRAGINRNMQLALWLFEGLRAAGLRLDRALGGGELQFPAETLGFMSGNGRDLAVLYAAVMESAGVSAALVPLGDDCIAVYSLAVDANAGKTLFRDMERLLVSGDGLLWMPLSMNALNEGFMAAWNQGAAEMNRAIKAGEPIPFVALENAWASYPPAPLPVQTGRIPRADENALARSAAAVTGQYIEQELQPLLRETQAQINANPSAALYNRLGILLARCAQTAGAKAAFERAAGMAYLPAMTNRGNLALAEGDYAAAARWFTEALSRDGGNKAALRGLEQAGERK